jgi:hypothetical protein
MKNNDLHITVCYSDRIKKDGVGGVCHTGRKCGYRRDDDTEASLSRNCVGRRWLRIGLEVGSVECGYEHSGRRTVRCKGQLQRVT